MTAPSRIVKPPRLGGMALALLAAFWLIIAAGLLFAPDDVLKASPAARRYGAIGCFIFAASCIVALAA